MKPHYWKKKKNLKHDEPIDLTNVVPMGLSKGLNHSLSPPKGVMISTSSRSPLASTLSAQPWMTCASILLIAMRLYWAWLLMHMLLWRREVTHRWPICKLCSNHICIDMYGWSFIILSSTLNLFHIIGDIQPQYSPIT